MNRRQASKQETRQLILTAAQALFIEKGVEKCTMRGIAEKAGVSAASVVVHFKNKTALLEVALCEDIARIINRAMASLPANADLLTRLMHMPKALYRFYDTNRPLYRALIRNTAFETQADNPYLSKQLFEYMEFLSGLVTAEKNKGAVGAHVDPMVTAMSLASLYFGVLAIFFRTPEITPGIALESLRLMTEQHLTGIMVKDGVKNGTDS